MNELEMKDFLSYKSIDVNDIEISSYLTNKVVLVTGAGGTIGHQLCLDILRYNPKQLVLLDVNENNLYYFKNDINRRKSKDEKLAKIKISFSVTSIRNKKGLNEVFKKYNPNVCFHCAAHKHVPLMEECPKDAITNNIFGTKNVIECSLVHNLDKLIMISTDKAVNPINVVGATKKVAEMILQVNGVNGVTKMAAVRFGNILGSAGSVVPVFQTQIEDGGPITITDKRISRYFMDLKEACRLILQSGYYANKGEIFLLDKAEPIKILDMAEKMIRFNGYKPYTDINILETGLRKGERLEEEITNNNETKVMTHNSGIVQIRFDHLDNNNLNVELRELNKLVKEETDYEIIKKRLLEIVQ